MRPVIIGLCVICLPRAGGQFLFNYPADRALCPSDDLGCLVGTLKEAAIFPIRTVKRPIIKTEAGRLIKDKDPSFWSPPEGHVFDYTGGLVPRAAEYVAPTEYVADEAGSEEGRIMYTELHATITINETGHFNPPRIGVQAGTMVTWELDTYEDADIVSDPTANASEFEIRSGRMNLMGGSARVRFSISFGAPNELADVVGPSEGLFQFVNRYAWDVTWRRRDGNPYTGDEAPPPPARGSILVKPLICSQLTDCTNCLLYVQCIWCIGTMSCMARNVSSNLPDDTGNVIHAAPHTNPETVRNYDNLRYYTPTLGAYGLDWYPWPAQRTMPRPVRKEEIPAFPVFPVSSDQCPLYANRTLGPKVCEAYRTPAPRERVTGRETPGRPQTEEVMQCYAYVRGKFRDMQMATSQTSAAEPPPPPPPPQRPTASASASSLVSNTLLNGTVLNASALNASRAADEGLDAGDAGDASEGSAGLGAGRRLETAFVGLSAPDHALAANLMQQARAMASNDDAGFVFRRRRGDAAATEQGTLPAAPSDTVSIEREQHWRRLPTMTPGEGRDERGEHEGRRLQTATGEVKEELLSRAEGVAKHWRLSVEEKISLIPDWQRRLLRSNEIGTPEAFNIIRRRIAELYTDQACNATDGCNLQFGRCLNTTGGDIYLYDQNGTCVCHHWFSGGDCSQAIVNGGVCDYMSVEGPASLDPHDCAALRTKLYLCSEVTPSDGLPSACMERGFTALECLEAGFMSNAAEAHRRHPRLNPDDVTRDRVREEEEANARLTAALNASLRESSSWLLSAAALARTEVCEALAAGQMLASEAPGIDCSKEVISGGAKSRTDGEGGERGYTSSYIPNLIGHDEEGWAMTMCAKCIGRPETMVKMCRPSTFLKQCQREENRVDQNICNMCGEDLLGNMMQDDTRKCSLFRGTCDGAVEKRLRGIVPPNLDVVGRHFAGGLRYCAKPGPFSTSQHYYSEADIISPGQSCIDNVPMYINWDMSKLPHDPRTVRDELGYACADPDDEATCPRQRRCWDESLCHPDRPDWSDDEILRLPYPAGWGEGTEKYLDPREEHSYPGLPEGYTYHLEAAGWAVLPPATSNLLDGEEKVAS